MFVKDRTAFVAQDLKLQSPSTRMANPSKIVRAGLVAPATEADAPVDEAFLSHLESRVNLGS